MNDVLVAEELIGDDADQFLHSELGQTILGIATQEREAALEQLKVVDPEDVKTVRKLQNDIWLAERFEGWLRELIYRGTQATKILEHDEGFQ